MKKKILITILVVAVIGVSFVIYKTTNKKQTEPMVALYSNGEKDQIGYSIQNYDSRMMTILINQFNQNPSLKIVPFQNDEALYQAIQKNEINQYMYRTDTWQVTEKLKKVELIESVIIDNTVVDEPQTSFNIYMAGIDTREGDSFSNSFTDANQIVTINLKTREMLITSIPRDFYVVTPCSNGQYDKLTHAGMNGGIECSKGSLETLLGIKIDYYVRSNFTTFIQMIDLIGGIDPVSQQAFEVPPTKFVEGVNHLNGTDALVFARARKGLPGGDRYRVGSQSNIIKAFAETLNDQNKLNMYLSLMPTVLPLIQTNMTFETVLELSIDQMNHPEPWIITQNKLDGSDGQGTTFSYPDSSDYYMIPDPTNIENGIQMIQHIYENTK